jgi:plasmid stabilization system protein ParE
LAQVVYSERALADLERVFVFLAEDGVPSGIKAVVAIRSAIEILASHPVIGRAVESGLREIVISFGRTGYLALYWFAPERDEVQILGIRHQRELDYPA